MTAASPRSSDGAGDSCRRATPARLVPVRYASRDPPPPTRRDVGPAERFDGPRRTRADPETDGRAIPRRSHAAAFVAIGLLLVGAYLAHWTILVPGLLALLLLSSGLSFLSARVNPLSIGFYLTTKPSWTAIGTVFLSGVVLLAIAYGAWRSGWGPVLPDRLVP